MTTTPTPWMIDPMSDETIAICGASDCGNGDLHVCTLETRDVDEDRREADAVLIVTAVNQHAALRTAAEAAIEHLAAVRSQITKTSFTTKLDAILCAEADAHAAAAISDLTAALKGGTP